MSASSPESKEPRPRGAVVARAVLDTTLSLLAERGYEFSVDDVAERAGVHKTTVYRRWETKARLIADALTQLAGQDVTAPATGDALADLEVLAIRVARALRAPASANALRAAFATAGSDPELRAVAAQFLSSRYATATQLVRQAQDDGIIDPALDAGLIWQAVVNPLHVNAVLGGPLTDATARALCRIALDGARTGPRRPAGVTR